jgi:hypothetical protein
MKFLPISLMVCLVLGMVRGQASKNRAGSISVWRQMRLTMIRNTVYIDGGTRIEQYPGVLDWPTSKNVFYVVNFTVTFDVTRENLTNIFTPISAGPTANHPSYFSGYIFADKSQFYAYGGLAGASVFTRPSSDFAYGYAVYAA